MQASLLGLAYVQGCIMLDISLSNMKTFCQAFTSSLKNVNSIYIMRIWTVDNALRLVREMKKSHSDTVKSGAMFP